MGSNRDTIPCPIIAYTYNIFCFLLRYNQWVNPLPRGFFVRFGIQCVGWIRAFGLLGKNQMNGEFSGYMVGFTGIKITTKAHDHIFLGTALYEKFNQK